MICYLKGTIHLKFVYKAQAKNKKETKASIVPSLFKLIGYKDSRYIGDLKSKKLVIRYCYFINRVIVSWCSKKPRIVLTSTTKAKYIIFDYTD